MCSTQGTSDYATFLRTPYVGLIQLLQTFRSCKPLLVRVLEHLPQLLPREYSIASFHGKENGRLRFVFNVIELPDFPWVSKRFGLCTKWLDDITTHMRSTSGMVEKLDTMSIQDTHVPMYFRKPTGFRFPDDPTKPLIMIGPGTGVAPYVGFLEKREQLRESNPEVQLGPAVLFFGCWYRGKDELYGEVLEEFKRKGILTELFTCYSREGGSEVKYVQHNILAHRQLVCDLLFKQGGAMYICGDAKGMGRDVTNTVLQLIQDEHNLTDKMEAVKMLNTMRENKQFLEDVWT